MNRRTLAVLLVLALPLLAGCVGSSGDGGEAPVNDSGAAPDAEAATDGSPAETRTPVGFAAGNEPLVRWINGTYQTQQACNVGGCFTGDAWRTQAITEIVPADVPVTVTLDLSYETGTTLFGDEMEVWFSTSDTSFYTFDYEEDDAQGTVHANTTLVRAESGAVDVVLFGSWPNLDPDAAVDYELRVQATPVQEVVASGMPVEASLRPGQTVTARSAGDGDAVAFRVYGPDDTFLADVAGAGPTTYRVPDDAAEGRYVLATASASSPLVYGVAGSDPGSLRALTLSWSVSEPTRYDGTGQATWSFDLESHPLSAGIYVQDGWDDTPFGAGPWVTAEGFDTRLTLPDGSTDSGSWDCTPCFTPIGSVGVSFGTDIADPALVPGTYEGQVSATAAAEFEYGHVVATYAR